MDIDKICKISMAQVEFSDELKNTEELKKECIKSVIYDYEVHLTPSEYLDAVQFMKKYKRKTDPKRILELSYNHFTGIAKIKEMINIRL